MPLPNDDTGRPPFTSAEQDDGPGDSALPPAPPAMRSPYRPDEQVLEDPHHKHVPLRFPSLHHGAGHDTGRDAGHEQLRALPVGQRPKPELTSGWGTGSAEGAGEGFPPGPPQFSYRPEVQPTPDPVSEAPGTGRRKVVVWTSAGAALVAVAVGVGVLVMGSMDATNGSIAGPTPSHSKVQPTNTTSTAPKNTPTAWTAPAAGDQAAVIGSWLVDDKTIVRGDAAGLKAYDTATGQAQWTFQPPGQGTTICAMSQQAAPKIGLVQYGPNGVCTTVAAIDADTGKSLWNTTLVVPPGSPPGTLPAVSLDSEVTVWQAGTTMTAWGTASGKQLWTTDLAKAKPVCKLGQFGSQDGNLALIEDCGTGPIVAMKDSHTGRDLWHTPLPPNGLQGAQLSLVNASPAIVHVTSQGAQPVDSYITFDPAGKLLPPINGNGDYGVLDLNVGPQGQLHPLVHVQDNVFIAPTVDKDAKASLVAFDLNTGGKLWQAPATASGPVTIVALNQKWVTVFDGGAAGSAPRIVAFGTSSGGPTASGVSKETLAADWSGPASAAYIAGNRVIVLPAAPEKGADVLAFAWGDAQ